MGGPAEVRPRVAGGLRHTGSDSLAFFWLFGRHFGGEERGGGLPLYLLRVSKAATKINFAASNESAR